VQSKKRFTSVKEEALFPPLSPQFLNLDRPISRYFARGRP
jgi:hypothetical protein